MAAAPTALPPFLYLPCAEPVPDPADAVIDLRHLSDGRVALLAYTALDRLHRCCGIAQPWVVLPTNALPLLRDTNPWDALLLDTPIPGPERRHASDEDLR